MNSKPSICTASFYGSEYKVNKKILKPSSKDVTPYVMKDLVNGPPITWKVFKKQAEALDFISKYKHDLMAFAFECNNTRLFLVAHPEVFWHYDCQRPPSCRCSYEIIPENTACKLYFDLEFNIPLNPVHNGPRMVQNFIILVNFYIKKKFKVNCNLDYVINLDASTGKKFSRHLIFDIPNVCFANNNHAGNFVNFVCRKILEINENNLVPPEIRDLTVENCLEMVIADSKGNKTLFCDLSVYSRNRHFRLYRSTKYGKYAPLLLSSDCRAKYNSDKELFFNSLITHNPVDFEEFNVLCFEKSASKCQKLIMKTDDGIYNNSNEVSTSPYINIDNFINDLVFPGKIYRSFYFSTSKVINYDIVGNRFCGNIGRSHKSNNVKYVVDLKDGTYYQKCHDYECSKYRSQKNPLPKKLQLSDFIEASSNLGVFGVSENATHSLQRFPSCGLSDEEIINHFSIESIHQFSSCDLNREETVPLPSSNSLQRFPSFDLSDEDIIKHFSAENFNI